MVSNCCICKWRGNKQPRRSYHKFPNDKQQRQKWLDAIGRADLVVTAASQVCSIHFECNCFRYGVDQGRRILNEGSIPTLHLTNEINADTPSKVSTILVEENVNVDEVNRTSMPELFDTQYFMFPSEDVVEEICDFNQEIFDSNDKLCGSDTEEEGKSTNGEIDNENQTEQKIYSQNHPSNKLKKQKYGRIKLKYFKNKLCRKNKEISYLKQIIRRLRKSNIVVKSQLKALKRKIEEKKIDKELMRVKIIVASDVSKLNGNGVYHV